MAAQVQKSIEQMTADEVSARIHRGLKRAIRNEVVRLRREGLPVWIWKDGKVVNDNLQPRRRKAAKSKSSRSSPRRGR
jgi:hypothetical protein